MILYVFQAGLLVYVSTQGSPVSANTTAVGILFDAATTDPVDDQNKALILTSILVAVLENVALVKRKIRVCWAVVVFQTFCQGNRVFDLWSSSVLHCAERKIDNC